jgi:hypothetical protein
VATAQWGKGADTNSEHKTLRAEVPSAGYLVLKLRRYPAWLVSVNGKAAKVLDIRQDGLMAIAVPKGSVEVRADWTTTPDVVAGRCISAVFLLIVIWMGVMRRRERLDARIK